eukprot:scaffold11809_cov128-Cylindrotheca_fusiformis.AAC.15
MKVSSSNINDHLALQGMVHGTGGVSMMGTGPSHFSAVRNPVQSTVAQLVEFEAALLARRAMQQPNAWLLDQLLAVHAKSLPLKSQLNDKVPISVRPSSPDSVLRIDRRVPISKSVIPPMANDQEKRIQMPSDSDILCGRGGRSNHHVGNKRYRQVVAEMKASYRTIGSKSAKTDLSRAIVEHVKSYGGRFLKLDKDSGMYVVLSQSEARKKTSQALREAKDVKWTK